VHVERFLCSGGSHDRLAQFSREAVEQRLEKVEARIEAELRKENVKENAGEN
jgi:hypothetical protein